MKTYTEFLNESQHFLRSISNDNDTEEGFNEDKVEQYIKQYDEPAIAIAWKLNVHPSLIEFSEEGEAGEDSIKFDAYIVNDDKHVDMKYIAMPEDDYEELCKSIYKSLVSVDFESIISYQTVVDSDCIDENDVYDKIDDLLRSDASNLLSASSDKFGNRLVEELYDNGVIDDDDFECDDDDEIDYEKCAYDDSELEDKYVDNNGPHSSSDAIEWYVEYFDINTLMRELSCGSISYDVDKLVDYLAYNGDLKEEPGQYLGDEVVNDIVYQVAMAECI